jgi:hypothetical protein
MRTPVARYFHPRRTSPAARAAVFDVPSCPDVFRYGSSTTAKPSHRLRKRKSMQYSP